MNKETNELLDCFYNAYINSLIFNVENIKIVNSDISIMQDQDFIKALINRIKCMNEGTTYPITVLQNLKKLIGNVSMYTQCGDKQVIEKEYKKLLFNKMGNGIYLEEYRKRFMEPEEVIQNILYIEKGDINNSIVFDFALIYSLINPDEKIRVNEYYLYSMKAIINDYPGLFTSIQIKKRAIEILNAQEKSDLRDRLIYKIQHINKFIKNKVDYSNIKAAYKYILVQNMLIDREILNENIEDMDYLIETLKDIIDHEYIGNKYEQNNALTMIDSYRNNSIINFPEDKNSVIDETNEYIIKTNSIEPNNKKRATENYMRFGNIGIKGMIDNFSNTDILIKNDLRVMTYLLTGKNQGIYLDDAYLSIRKILFLCPSLFDNQKVYERTESLLELNNNKKELKKVKRIYKG